MTKQPNNLSHIVLNCSQVIEGILRKRVTPKEKIYLILERLCDTQIELIHEERELDMEGIKSEFLKKLKHQIKDDEDFREYPYDDHTGKRLKKGDTIKGVITFGHGLTYLTEEESDHVVQMRLEYIIKERLPLLPETGNCNEQRLIVIISMIYQVGFRGYKLFKNMRQAIQDKDWQKSHDECLDSKAYKYGLPGVKKRFEWYAKTLLKGE